MMESLLSGVKVLDLTWYITGPACTKLLADYGADVIKIERPDSGDPARLAGPFLSDIPHPDKCLLFSYLNLNKRGITLDLKSDTGKKIFLELVKDVDIVVENFRPGVMDRLGLGYETLKRVNPTLIMAAISNFGQDGPYRDFKASDLVLTGLGKDQYSHGNDGREPLKWAGNTALNQAGYLAAASILASYWMVITQGVGQYVDCSIQQMLATDVDLKRHNMYTWTKGGPRYFRRDPTSTVVSIARAGVFPCKDGFVRVSADFRIWPRFVEMIQSKELQALRYPEDLFDMEYLPMVDAIWYNWCGDRTKQEIMEVCQAHKVWSGVVNTPMDALNDPQFASRGFWVEVEHPVSGKQIYPGPPVDIPENPWVVRFPAPLLGQHNEDIFCGTLGYSKDDLAKLREERVI